MYSKKRKINVNDISISNANKNKKSEKSEINDDDEVYYKLINCENPNELIFNDLKYKNALSAIKELQNYYSTLKSTTHKLHQIAIANKNKYNKGEIGDKLFESKRLINLLNLVNIRINDD